MPELRKDPIIGRWVIISKERGKRPIDFQTAKETRTTRSEDCPFCYENEDKTPPEVLAFRKNGAGPNTPGWSVRVVPNKFPALQIEGDLGRKGDGIYDFMNGVGAHEVVIETPDHEAKIARMSVDHVREFLVAVQSRITDLNRDPRFKYIQVFKNRGKEAGASLEHPHTQIIATPIIPKRIVEEMEGARLHHQMKERCIYCDIVNQELEDGRRLVETGESFVSFAPFAPRFPFETWLLPREHHSSFEKLPPELFSDLAGVLGRTLARIDTAIQDPPYNLVLHTSPCKNPDVEHYHMHFEIMPKLTLVAGFEWGSGFFINPTPPELAAEALREIDISALPIAPSASRDPSTPS